MKKLKDTIYYAGVIISFLALGGVAESITGNGDTIISIVLFIVGLGMCLVGYI